MIHSDHEKRQEQPYEQNCKPSRTRNQHRQILTTLFPLIWGAPIEISLTGTLHFNGRHAAYAQARFSPGEACALARDTLDTQDLVEVGRDHRPQIDRQRPVFKAIRGDGLPADDAMRIGANR
ncbi:MULTISPECIES: hypothetical protein [unclassified Mesorhizobium]|uniref:hypothetical protein n=1 Tax=unclassified Mesorhizobium TaxID=325217 RepID=UPI003335540E